MGLVQRLVIVAVVGGTALAGLRIAGSPAPDRPAAAPAEPSRLARALDDVPAALRGPAPAPGETPADPAAATAAEERPAPDRALTGMKPELGPAPPGIPESGPGLHADAPATPGSDAAAAAPAALPAPSPSAAPPAPTPSDTAPADGPAAPPAAAPASLLERLAALLGGKPPAATPPPAPDLPAEVVRKEFEGVAAAIAGKPSGPLPGRPGPAAKFARPPGETAAEAEAPRPGRLPRIGAP